MRCDFCGSTAECYSDCECSKCRDPEGYEEWRQNDPEGYDRWIEKKKEEEYEEY